MNIQPINIIILGTPRVKKNSMTTSYIYKDKNGSLKIRGDGKRFAPVTFYSKAYTEWARNAVETLIAFKSKNIHIEFPIKDKVNLKCLFFMDKNSVVDQSALYEGIQDTLIGKPGVLKGVDPRLYQILEDDSVRFVGSHDGSRTFLDYVNPRMEITISDYVI